MDIGDAKYIAGLFDGEGSIYYKKLFVKKKDKKKGYYTWQIRMELSMTDKDVVEWIWKSFKCGTFEKRNMTSKDINRGDIVFQISSGRLGIITESSVRVDKENTNQIEFDWYASVL